MAIVWIKDSNVHSTNVFWIVSLHAAKQISPQSQGAVTAGVKVCFSSRFYAKFKLCTLSSCHSVYPSVKRTNLSLFFPLNDFCFALMCLHLWKCTTPACSLEQSEKLWNKTMHLENTKILPRCVHTKLSSKVAFLNYFVKTQRVHNKTDFKNTPKCSNIIWN